MKKEPPLSITHCGFIQNAVKGSKNSLPVTMNMNEREWRIFRKSEKLFVAVHKRLTDKKISIIINASKSRTGLMKEIQEDLE